MSLSCEQYHVAQLRIDDAPREFVSNTVENGDVAETFVLQGSGHRLKKVSLWKLENSTGHSKNEAVTACVASRQGSGPVLHDAWKTTDGYMFLEMDNYERSLAATMESIAKNQADHDGEALAVDAALRRLYGLLASGTVCHRDLHPGNVVLKHTSCGMDARVIDFSTSFYTGACASTDFDELVTRMYEDWDKLSAGKFPTMPFINERFNTWQAEKHLRFQKYAKQDEEYRHKQAKLAAESAAIEKRIQVERQAAYDKWVLENPSLAL